MILASLRPIGRLVQAICGGATQHEIALGLSLGLVLGLLPKSNLTAVALCGLILSLRLNLNAAGLATLAGMALAPMTEGLASPLGMLVLTLRPLDACWAWLFNLPIVPWLRLDDSVVLGQLLIGIALAWPTYSVSRRSLAKLQPGLTTVATRFAPLRLFVGVPMPSERRAA